MSAPYVTRRSSSVNGFATSLVLEARELGKGGWEPAEIVRLFARRGVDPLPTPSAVRWWLVGSADFERQMEHQRRSKARRQAEASGGRFVGGRPRSPEFKLIRARALVEDVGISANAAAKVLTFDLGEPVTEHQIRHALEVGRWPKPRKSSISTEGTAT